MFNIPILAEGSQSKKALRFLLDLSVRVDGLNTGRVYTGSGKIRVGYISGSGKIRAGVFRFYGFRINPTDLERPFLGYFFFCQNKKFSIFIT